jgi:hypothetical protein
MSFDDWRVKKMEAEKQKSTGFSALKKNRQ